MSSGEPESDLWVRVMKELGHDPVRKDDGSLDCWVCDVGHCNGPGCGTCHDSWCMHCITDPHKIGPCDNPVIDATAEPSVLLLMDSENG